MDAQLASRLPLEMLHGIRHVDFAAIDLRFFQSLVQQFSRRPDKRFSLLVFLVTRLFADHHDRDLPPRPTITRVDLSKHSLRCIAIQIASLALLHRRSQHRQGATWRHKWLRTLFDFCRHATTPLHGFDAHCD
jgi:hypothetical protein